MNRMERFLTGLTLILLAAISVSAQRRERTVDTWKPIHYYVNLSFDDQLTQLTAARTEISIEVLADNLTIVDLDFGDLPIDSVLVGGAVARFERTPETLNVRLSTPAKQGDKLNVTVNYHGHPKDGLVFANDRDGHPSATGDNWPNRVHQWIPCLDHPSAKATVTFSVTASVNDEAVANGRLIDVSGSGGTSTWKFDEAKPIPPYCMVVAVSQGAKLDTLFEAVPLSYYVPQKDHDYAGKGFAPAAPALAFFSQTIAPYPYEKLALIIGATRFGGMENSSAIVFTSTLFDLRTNERTSPHFGIPARIEDVVAHEIAHQWFGDSVTESTWADLWLSEGFATYFAGLFIEKHDGGAAFREYMNAAAQRYFNYERQRNAPIHDAETQDLMQLLNPNNYQKGAWILHMLRTRLGDEVFFKGLRDYYNAHMSANASTEDLRAALEKASGENLKDFFARWIYGSGHPVYEVTHIKTGDLVKITLTQTQTGDAFLDRVPIEIASGDEKTRVLVRPQSKIASTQVRVKGQSVLITVDPDGTLLKEVRGQ